MDQGTSTKNDRRGAVCQRIVVQGCCVLCPIDLCKYCAGEHASDVSREHDLVSINPCKSRFVYPMCETHVTEHCAMYCEDCNISVCEKCITSSGHMNHHFRSLQSLAKIKREAIENEKIRLQGILKYETIATDIESQIAALDRKYNQLTSEVTKHGDELHREIDTVIQKTKTEIDEMRKKHEDVLTNHLADIKKLLSEVQLAMSEIGEILNSNELLKVAAFQRKSNQLYKFPKKMNVTPPVFKPIPKQRAVAQFFGFLSSLTISTDDHGIAIETSMAESFLSVKSLLAEPELIVNINTGYYRLFSVICLNDEEFWTLGNDKIIRLYNLDGKLLRSLKTTSAKRPHDIAVSKSGDLVYTDPGAKTVNIMKNEDSPEVIRLQGWVPFSICSTSSGDLLVTMESDNRLSKIVRFSNSNVTQTIQFDRNGRLLFSSYYLKYIAENMNQDICVADNGTGAVMVVNQAGQFRFRYTGHSSSTKALFDPVGITADSQSQILIANRGHDCVHILDQNGCFLRYIDNCRLRNPWGLCVDSRDNLFVVGKGGKLTKVKYM